MLNCVRACSAGAIKTNCVFVFYACLKKLVCIDSLSAIRHERELSLVLSCQFLFVWFGCALRKPYIRSLNWYGFKTHDFSLIDMIIKIKLKFWQDIWVTSCKDSLILERRVRGAAAHLHLKIHARKQCFCFHSKYAISKYATLDYKTSHK